ncbi:MAG: GAF domain-containing protein [Sphingomicrobium sp.]|nr:GAF domain-containing protein [Sphingomonadales bacterium]
MPSLDEFPDLSPHHERDRMQEVQRLAILDTPPDGAFDRITEIAAKLFSVPISIISVVDHDRIWFKSHRGVDVTEIDRSPGLCASAILHDGPWVLTDAAADARSLANPLVAGEFGLRFYAGAPLRTKHGYNLGTLCVIDHEPREITEEQITQLQDLAALVVDQLELRLEAREAVSEMQASHDRLADEQHALEVLNRTGARVAAELELGKVVQLVVDAGVELTGAQFGAFFYNVEREDGERLMLYTLAGADIADFEKFGLPRPTEVFAPTFRGEGVICSQDITKDSRYGKNLPHSGMPPGHLPVRSYLAVPVISRSSEVIGGLFFGHGTPGVFSERSARIMDGLAAQAAVAIDNARLFEVVQRAKQDLEERVRERTGELEQAHEALRQAQKMEAIGQLTGGIAHDFNNLLTVIKGSADLLARVNLTEEKRGRYVKAIADTADRAANLTGQLLAFARRQSLKPEVFDAAIRIHGIADMLRTILGSRVQLEIEDNCNDCFIKADAGQFETVVVNLAVNARDAMEGEGVLRISIGPSDEADATSMIAVSVHDTGQGIDPVHLDRIFEPFYTTKEVGKGTGLGLSQVYGFVKQSDGEITVVSDVGVGTEFTLGFPRAAAQRDEDQSRRVPGPAGGRGHVLIVEDNASVGEFAAELLGELGFETSSASNAQDALRQLEQPGSDFDIVFSDVVMPGMDGVEFGRKLRERWPQLPVVLTSGYSHVLAAGSNHGFPLLHKPYSVEALSRILAEARSTREP